MPEMVPVVTPPLKVLALRCHGKWVVFTVNVRPSGPVQLLKDSAVIEAMPVPDRPLPFLAVPLPLDVLQVRTLPVLVSFSVVTPALAVMAPPGLTVQVAATPVWVVAAIAELADRASTPASAALMTRALPARLKIVIVSLSMIGLPARPASGLAAMDPLALPCTQGAK